MIEDGLKMKGFGDQPKSKKGKETNKNTKPSKEQIINQAFHFHSQGNISEAAKYYQYFINQGFNDPRVFSNYGTILIGIGKLKEAEILIRTAIKLKPNYAEAHSNLGTILIGLGQLQEAETSTRKAIELNPNYGDAHLNLGTILKDFGKLKEAEISTRKAIELTNESAKAHYNLGTILIGLGQLKEAEISTRRAIEINPDFAMAHCSLGSIFIDLGQLKEAEISTRKSIELKPDYAIAHSNLGNILSNLGKLKEASLSTRKAIELKPDFAMAHLNLGSILKDLGKLQEAEVYTRKAIEIKPDYTEAYSNLGNILRLLSKYNDAIDSYRKAIKLDSNSSSAKSGLIASKGTICDWSDQDTQNTWIKTLGIEGSPVSPGNLFCSEDNPLNHLKRSQNLYKKNFARKEYEISSLNNKEIHIGYFSSDFRAHPTMYLIARILKLHDKSKFKIYLYSFSPKEDEYTEIAKNSGCVFRDIKELNDTETVELARGDKLDIAIDLMGYISYNRMSIFSNRVAPIQINYLGYPGSVGADTIDYILVDEIIIPKENEKFYSEKVIRMPNCYQCNDNKKEICTETISRKDFNLPEKGFVFTCFNNNYKITEQEFDIWMRLLTKIKGSVLWLYKSNELSIKNLYKEAGKRNVDPDRLIFSNKLPLKKHLARHSLGDLGIDTFNVNGHTTTSDALWAGLPVLTKIGEGFPARVSASLLTSIGLPELITYTEKEYEEKALHIASNPNELIRLKTKLARLRETSPLYNSELFTTDLETKFTELIN